MTGRVAVVTEIIAPYRIPLFNALHEELHGRLEVFFISESERRRDWRVPTDEIRFPYQVLGGLQVSVPLRGDYQPVYLAPPLLPRLVRGRFDTVLVGGWNHVECYWSLAYARAWRRRFVFWSETPLLDELPRRPLRTALKRLVVRLSDGFAVPGPSAGRYLEALGAPRAKIRIVPNALDTDFWSAAPPALPAFDARPVLLFAGRLVSSKGLDLALRAYAASRLAGRSTFVVAGDGPERAALEALAVPGVRFLGSCDRERLRALYHAAELLVFPSRYDPWGFVVTEAACAGVAAIASDGAGATRDLVRDGENGLVVARDRVDALRAAFDRVADDPDLPRRLGARARELAAAHTPRAGARALLEAVR